MRWPWVLGHERPKLRIWICNILHQLMFWISGPSLTVLLEDWTFQKMEVAEGRGSSGKEWLCLTLYLLVCCDMNSLHHMLLPPWSEVFPHAVPRWTKILWNHEPKITEVVFKRYYGNINTKVAKAPSSSVFYICSNELKAVTYWYLLYIGPCTKSQNSPKKLLWPKSFPSEITMQSDSELIQSNI